MRVLFTTWDWSGHFYPLVPLGWALRAAGHEVLVATDPGFAPAVVRAGLPALAVGPRFDSAQVLTEQIKKLGWVPKPPARRTADAARDTQRTRRRSLLGLRIAAEAASAQADELVRFCGEWRPDLAVFEPMGFAGPLVARLLGVPAVRHLWGLDMTSGVAAIESDIVGELGARFGLDEIGIGGTMTLDPCPARVQVADGTARHPIRLVPYNGPSVAPGWLRDAAERPRICVSWGNSLDRFGFGDLILAPLVAEALASIDVEVILAVSESQRAKFGPLPDNVRHAGPVPLNLLLPSCAALVHQGGAGTMMAGLLNGLPQMAIAHIPEGAMHGYAIEESGTGRFLPGREATAELIRENVLALLSDPAIAQAAREARADILARPASGAVVRQLEGLVSSGLATAAAAR
jgi:UDP:flavonoid glycosyltransferase YjiC (YdhE family)